MKKNILSMGLALVLSLSLTATAIAATKVVTKPVTKPVTTSVVKPVTKTVTFNSYATQDRNVRDFKTTLSISNVTAQAVKDYSVTLSDGKKKLTFAGKKSNVLTCKAPVTVTLLPNKGEKNAGLFDFYAVADASTYKSVKIVYKYYVFNTDKYEFDFSKKLSAKPSGTHGVAEGSTQTLSKAGTYVIYTRHMSGADDTGLPLTPVFIVVK